MRSPALALVALLLAFASAAQAAAPSAREGRSWPEEKCARYGRAWTELMARRGGEGLGRAFIERHDAFLASGCATRPDVCPRSQAELAAANVLVIAAMNAGLPSTFLPFSCGR